MEANNIESRAARMILLLLSNLLFAIAIAENSDHSQLERTRRDVDWSLPANAPRGRSAPRASGAIAFNRGNSCPSDNPCTSLMSCNAFASRATDRSPENADFIRSVTCGFKGRAPMVCCPSGSTVGTTRIDKTQPPVLQTPKSTTEETCGLGGFSLVRVVGGTPATLGDWPWAVAIYVDDHFSCGGTLINHNFILTAAHCVISASHGGNQIPTSSYSIRLGDLDLESDDDGGTPITLRLKKAMAHPNFLLSNFHNDIAVMQLERSVEYNEFIRPACLPTKDEVDVTFANMGAILLGWGTTGFEKAASPYLQYVPLPIQPLAVCEKAFQKYNATHPIIPSQLCGGLLTGRKDACQGDSGGPLVLSDPHIKGSPWTLVGIVSYGFKCAEVGFPGIYTRVTAFLDWIEANTQL
uniref:CLIP domain-containing serine protease n=1 Tax=Strigamia maritima TaxID=126957 RepID=T1JDJ8_STRMM